MKKLLFMIPLLLGLVGCFEDDEKKASSEKAIKTMELSFGELKKTVTFEDYKATVELDFGTSTEATVKYAVSDKAKLMKGDAEVKNGSKITFDLGAETKFKVIAEDGSSVEYTLMVKNGADNTDIKVESLRIKIEKTGEYVTATAQDKNFTVELPYGTDLANDKLLLDIKHNGASVAPAQDAELKLTAGQALDIVISKRDNTTVTYKLTATVRAIARQIKEVENVSVELTPEQKQIGSDPDWGSKVESKIDKVDNKVEVTLPVSVNGKIEGKTIKTSLGISPGTKLSSTDEDINATTGEVKVNFSKTYKYTLTDEAGNQTEYTLKFVQKLSSDKAIASMKLVIGGVEYEVNFNAYHTALVAVADPYQADGHTLKETKAIFTIDAKAEMEFVEGNRSGFPNSSTLTKINSGDVITLGNKSNAFEYFVLTAEDGTSIRYALRVVKANPKLATFGYVNITNATGHQYHSRATGYGVPAGSYDHYTYANLPFADISQGIHTRLVVTEGTITYDGGKPFVNGQMIKYTEGKEVGFEITSTDGSQKDSVYAKVSTRAASTDNGVNYLIVRDASDRIAHTTIEEKNIVINVLPGTPTNAMVVLPTYAQFATADMSRGVYDFTLNEEKTIKVTAQNGDVANYTLTVKEANNAEPTPTKGKITKLLHEYNDGSGSLTANYAFSYGENQYINNIVSKIKPALGSERTATVKLFYNMFNRVYKIYDGHESDMKNKYFQYDTKGNIVKQIAWHPRANRFFTESFEYNDKNHLTRHKTTDIEVSDGGNLTKRGIGTYSSFDDKKNPFSARLPKAIRGAHFSNILGRGVDINYGSANNEGAKNTGFAGQLTNTQMQYNADGFLTSSKFIPSSGPTPNVVNTYTYE